MKKIIMVIIGIAIVLIIGFTGIRYMTGKAIFENSGNVKLETNYGDIVIELYPDKSPITVENFLGYVNDGAYDGTVFHRVIQDFMIQGGGFDNSGNQRETKNPITLEADNGIKNERGTVAMARTSVPNSATNQFFINLADNDFLNAGVRDEGHAVFGIVVEGMDVVDKIANVKTTTKNGMSDWPVKDVIIKRAVIV